MSNTIPEDDEFTELHDAVVPRVDLVGKGANGMPFLIAKGSADEAGIFSDTYVRHLIDTQENPVTAPVAKATDTMAADAVLGDDAPLPDGEELTAAATAGADGSGVPTDAPGDPDDPKSAAWEAVDAARARQALQLTVALKRLVTEAQDRETQEASVSGEEDDYDNSWSLGTVLCCLDEVLSLLAPFAITEQAEADQMTGDLAKSGRTLSAANEQKIRGATEALQSVLATLPAVTTDDLTVAKETTVPEIELLNTFTGDVDAVAKNAKAEIVKANGKGEVFKAKGDPMLPVYDENGKLLGMTDPTALVAIAGPEDTDAPTPDPAAEAEPAPVDGTPAVATIPGTATVQAPVQKNDENDVVAKAVADSVSHTLGEMLAPLAEQISKNADLADVVKGLQESVDRMSREPNDHRSPIVGGGTGTAGAAHRDGQQLDPYADLRKAVADAPTGKAKTEADMALAMAVIKGHPTVTGGIPASPWQANAADVTARFQS